MDLFITGGSGLLGTELRKQLDAKGISYYAPARDVMDLNSGPEIQMEFRQHDYIAAVHCGAVVDVDVAETSPDLTLSTNLKATAILADECRSVGIPMIFISTDYVFGGKNEEIGEWEEHNPLNIYGLSKSCAEDVVKYYLPGKNYILRTAGLYGASHKGYIPHVVRSLLTTPFPSGLLFRAPTHRTFQPTSVKRLAERIIECLFTDKIPSGTYHATGAGAATHLDVAKVVVDAINRLDSFENIRVQRDATWVDKTRRPASSILGHNGWALTDVDPMRMWKLDLIKDLPEIIDYILETTDS